MDDHKNKNRKDDLQNLEVTQEEEPARNKVSNKNVTGGRRRGNKERGVKIGGRDDHHVVEMIISRVIRMMHGHDMNVL